MPRGGRSTHEVQTVFTGDNTDLGQKANEGADAVQAAFNRIEAVEIGEELVSGIFKAATSVAVGSALVDGIRDNLDLGPVTSRVEAQLGLTAEEAERLGELGSGLYRDAWGQSTEEVVQALGRVGSQLVDLDTVTDERLESLTTRALDIAKTWDLDLNEVIRASSQLLDNDLAPTAEAALDQVAASLRNTQDRSDDLLDTVNEYAPQFQALGLTGEEALGILNAGIQEGVFNTDKLGDALKEFRVRAVEDNEEVGEAFAALALDADDVASAISAGGPAARDALGQVVEALQRLDDPLEQQRLATVLFGTAFEDLGPKALNALNPATSALADFDGAAQNASDTLNDNAATSVDEFLRKLDALDQEATAAAAPALGFLAEQGSVLLDVFLELPDPVQAVIGGLVGVGGVAIPAISAVGDLSLGVNGLGQLMSTLRDRTTGATGALGRFGPAMAAGGGAVVLAVTAINSYVDAKREAEERTGRFVEALRRDSEALDDNSDALGRNVQAVIDKALADADLFDDLNALDDVLGGQGEAYDLVTEALTGNKDALNEVMAALEDLDEAGGNAFDLGRFIGSQVPAFERATQALEDEAEAKRGSAAAAEDLAEATDDATTATEDNTSATEDGTVAAGDYASAYEQVTNAILAANDATLEAFNADLALENQLARTTSEIDQYEAAMADVNATTAEQEQATRDAEAASLRLAAQAVATAEAQAELDGKTLSATDRIGLQVAALVAVQQKLDPNDPLRQRLQEYIDQLNEIPSEIDSEIRFKITQIGQAVTEAINPGSTTPVLPDNFDFNFDQSSASIGERSVTRVDGASQTINIFVDPSNLDGRRTGQDIADQLSSSGRVSGTTTDVTG